MHTYENAHIYIHTGGVGKVAAALVKQWGKCGKEYTGTRSTLPNFLAKWSYSNIKSQPEVTGCCLTFSPQTVTA